MFWNDEVEIGKLIGLAGKCPVPLCLPVGRQEGAQYEMIIPFREAPVVPVPS